MATDWPEVTVADLASPTPNALATGPFGSSIGAKFFTNAGVPLIRGSNLSDHVELRLIHDDLVFVAEDTANRFERSVVRQGDLVFTCWGTIGQVGLIDQRCPYPRYLISNKQMKLTPHPDRADSLFLYYLFSGPELSQRIKNEAIGSSVPGFNLGQLRGLRVRLPPLSDQKAIAHILGALDDKIGLNRRMNQTLEAMAQALFQSWFVNFDPVRAKAESRQPEGMDAETAALFPRDFEATGEDCYPRGWRRVRWSDLVTLEYGKALRQYSGGQVPVFGTNGQIGFHDTPLCPHPGVIVGRKGAYRGVHYSPKPFYVIDTAYYIEPRVPLEMRWVYYELHREGVNSLDSGSAIPSTSRSDFYALQVIAPPHELQRRFVELMSPLWQRQEANEQENRTLTVLRDTLLPKLLSGEIRVADAEAQVAASA